MDRSQLRGHRDRHTHHHDLRGLDYDDHNGGGSPRAAAAAVLGAPGVAASTGTLEPPALRSRNTYWGIGNPGRARQML